MFVHVADRVVSEAILVALGRCGFSHLWKSGGWRALAAMQDRELASDTADRPTYTAYATLTADGWRVTAPAIDGAEVLVDNLQFAERALAPGIAVRAGVHVQPDQVYVIPIIDEITGA
jgi:hypothetical protein